MGEENRKEKKKKYPNRITGTAFFGLMSASFQQPNVGYHALIKPWHRVSSSFDVSPIVSIDERETIPPWMMTGS
jgi:hypothetical protein